MLLRASLLLFALPGLAQKPAFKNLPPASLSPNALLILDSVVTDQWPSTLDTVNAPTNITLINPGQCIRVAALS